MNWACACGRAAGVPRTAAVLWDSWTECVKALASQSLLSLLLNAVL